MNVLQALSAIEELLTARTGTMGKIICHKELVALDKRPEDLTPDDLDIYIKRIVSAITPIFGQAKAQVLGKELSTQTISMIYGGKRGPTAEDTAGTFEVVQGFFMYDDGRLLAHSAVKEDLDADKAIVSSMLTAVQSFIADSLGHGGTGALDELKYGKTTILMSRKNRITFAVVTAGTQFAPLRHYMQEALEEVVEHYTPILENWDGDINTVKGIKYYTDILCLSGPVSLEETPEDDRPRRSITELAGELLGEASTVKAESPMTVEVARDMDFYGGYVRIKVSIKNHLNSQISGVALKVNYNDSALRFERLDPVLDALGTEILLGTVGAGENKSFTIVFDPLLCTDSYVDGVLTYKDASGALETVKMKRAPVNLVCPTLSPMGEIDTNMLRKMVKSTLTHQDSRFFRYDRTDWQTTLDILKGALGKHDIRMIQEIHSAAKPQTIEVWYYSQIKGQKDRIIVRISIWTSSNTFEIFVASESLHIVTSFLAELRYGVRKGLERRSLEPTTYTPLQEQEVEGIIGPHTPLIMKTSEGELDPDSGEQ